MEVQAIIDDLARTIGRPITLEDAGGRLVAYSAHDQPVDSVRVETLLRRGASEGDAEGAQRARRLCFCGKKPRRALCKRHSRDWFLSRVALVIKSEIPSSDISGS